LQGGNRSEIIGYALHSQTATISKKTDSLIHHALRDKFSEAVVIPNATGRKSEASQICAERPNQHLLRVDYPLAATVP
jgi:hypothetical protein